MKLEKCRYCGKAPIMERKYMTAINAQMCRVKCSNTGCTVFPRTIWYYTEAQAGAAWNKKEPL